MSELKNCPFCGGKGHVELYSKDGTDMWYVQCLKCKASTWYAGTREEAQTEWNRRDSVNYPKLKQLGFLLLWRILALLPIGNCVVVSASTRLFALCSGETLLLA